MSWDVAALVSRAMPDGDVEIAEAVRLLQLVLFDS